MDNYHLSCKCFVMAVDAPTTAATSADVAVTITVVAFCVSEVVTVIVTDAVSVGLGVLRVVLALSSHCSILIEIPRGLHYKNIHGRNIWIFIIS